MNDDYDAELREYLEFDEDYDEEFDCSTVVFYVLTEHESRVEDFAEEATGEYHDLFDVPYFDHVNYPERDDAIKLSMFCYIDNVDLIEIRDVLSRMERAKIPYELEYRNGRKNKLTRMYYRIAGDGLPLKSKKTVKINSSKKTTINIKDPLPWGDQVNILQEITG